MSRPFDPALAAMGDEPLFGPVSFQQYLADHDLPPRDTATSISVDAIERLRPELREAQAMVLRLGSDAGMRTTRFALTRSPAGLEAFFLFHDAMFADAREETYLPRVSWRMLYAFQLLPSPSEAALINLALASGLLSTALALDDCDTLPPPATGQSTFSFSFLPYEGALQPLEHLCGQVECDALFIATREGRDCVFVIEAKVGSSVRSLAKHKLVYPVLAVAQHVPASMPIIPVYLHASAEGHGIRFRVVECSYADPRQGVPVLTSLQTVRTTALTIPLPFGR